MRSALSVMPVPGYMNWQVSALEIFERHARFVESSAVFLNHRAARDSPGIDN